MAKRNEAREKLAAALKQAQDLEFRLHAAQVLAQAASRALEPLGADASDADVLNGFLIAELGKIESDVAALLRAVGRAA